MLHITPGERAALRLLAEGKSRRELAASLEVSEPEVEARLMALFEEMGVKTEREDAAQCVKRGRHPTLTLSACVECPPEWSAVISDGVAAATTLVPRNR